MKIIITGIAGYLGMQLAKLYSGETRYHEIIGIDNRFPAASVSQLTKWGIKFVHGDILDEALIKETLKDADVVFHLAGVTDVAYTKTEANDEKDFKIRQTAIEGTLNIINHCTGKLIFPSTHVVFEGLKETEQEIDERHFLSPVLAYAESKAINEDHIIKSGINHVILRLGSVYGYSEYDSMRINIMPNLFSKIAAQNGTIKLYSGGKQWKSLVAIGDVVRCMKFMAESDIVNETFHLSHENRTIKQVAEICKYINPYIELIETTDEVPNLGYTLCNHKVRETGFKFLYNLEDEIINMVSKWKPKDVLRKETIITPPHVIADERGKIANYELTEPINLIGYITSKNGSVRANHYHPIQEQKCLLISGSYVSVTKDLHNGIIETRLIHAGDIAVIPANIAHAMIFIEDSAFLNLVNGDRDADKYGVTHTIPYELVNDELKDTILNYYKTECRVCGNKRLKDVISLGLSPLANNLLDSPEQVCYKYPLELKHCPECQNVQLSVVVPPQKMFDNYLYVSSTSPVFRKHFEDAAEKYIEEFGLDSNSLVVDIGSNDGVFLKPLMDKGIQVIGYEPASNLAEIANNNGITTFNSYFNSGLLYLDGRYVNTDLITASNVFAHADNISDITNNVFSLLKPDGVFIIEVQYLIDTIIDCTFDNIYHEHVNYWCVTSLNNFFTKLGYCLYKVEHIDTHGGSIRAYVKRSGEQEQSVSDYLEMEESFFAKKPFKSFRDSVESVKENVLTNITAIKEHYPHLAGYGSPAKATTALNYFGIDNRVIEHTWEDNDLKIGKLIPGVNIPIKKQIADMFIVLAWNFFDDIKSRNPDIPMISIKDLHLPPPEFATKFLPQQVHY